MFFFLTYEHVDANAFVNMAMFGRPFVPQLLENTLEIQLADSPS